MYRAGPTFLNVFLAGVASTLATYHFMGVGAAGIIGAMFAFPLAAIGIAILADKGSRPEPTPGRVSRK
jgi:hypothetical protein